MSIDNSLASSCHQEATALLTLFSLIMFLERFRRASGFVGNFKHVHKHVNFVYIILYAFLKS